MTERPRCGLWWIPLQLAWGFALAQRAAHQAWLGIRRMDVSTAINRQLTEQAAHDLLRLHDGEVSSIWCRTPATPDRLPGSDNGGPNGARR